MKKHVELLAPAGSYESMAAAVNAGADAVYMGGSRFGARAYADNPEEDRFLEAVDYAHLHSCRLYMTVNTLFKETELLELPDYLLPYYRQGIDAVIVQDLGAMARIREVYPDLPIHASTQMTVTGARGARLMKELGASRVVTARELSLSEIARIRDEVEIEIESFVHGALCYCYSGQCLLSSLIGGRSGNRGRCAQPCRLPYEVRRDGRDVGKKDERYVMSLKDLCTLEILPDIIEAGVTSLKIEGRMKSPRYTAGVVSVYRKYVDRYLECGRSGYRVDPADRELLLKLFDRGGFTDGYYTRHNGRSMTALKEKPAFKESDQGLFDRLDREYVEAKRQEPAEGIVVLNEGEPARFTVSLRVQNADGTESVLSAKAEGPVVQTAQSQPLTEEKLAKQMNKTGGSPFWFEKLEIRLTGNCFLPVQALNELRREGLARLGEAALGRYRREPAVHRTGAAEEMVCHAGSAAEKTASPAETARESAGQAGQRSRLRIHAALEEPDGFDTAVFHPDVDAVYLDAAGFDADEWMQDVQTCHRAGKQCALILPHIFRTEAETYLKEHLDVLQSAGFDELVIRSLEEVDFLREAGVTIPLVFDSGVYAMNRPAAEQMRLLGASRLTLPLELNSRELEHLGCGGAELIAYGHLPVMVTAQCVAAAVGGCKKTPGVLYLKDRTGKELPVKNRCRFCCNMVYNPSPLSLLGMEDTVRRLAPAVLRLSFTVEPKKQIQAVIDAYADHFLRGKNGPAPFDDFTRGHLKRGVE